MVLRSVVLIVWSLGWASVVLVQAPSKTWKTLDELSAQELQTLDLRDTTPRDAQIPYLPAEAYPFSPPYSAEELVYLAFDLDTPRPDQFYLRPRLYPDKFPHHRHIQLAPRVAARVAAQERAGHIVFEVNGQPSAGLRSEGSG